MQETNEPLELVERVAAIDIGKSGLVVCVRVPHDDKPGRRCQEVREYTTLTASLLSLADWLRCQSVTLVAREATSDYWKPVVRHDALFDRAEVKGLRRRAVAAV
ncbi:hypothetical protein AB0O34_07615 [Sphaerisporangium sp. NPDC088356]|uniref:hypothetical protein n=1 Tax=Sphaerisporangium sp. NPDC088356 TaxID=3154871 RepID=UPI0034128D3F